MTERQAPIFEKKGEHHQKRQKNIITYNLLNRIWCKKKKVYEWPKSPNKFPHENTNFLSLRQKIQKKKMKTEKKNFNIPIFFHKGMIWLVCTSSSHLYIFKLFFRFRNICRCTFLRFEQVQRSWKTSKFLVEKGEVRIWKLWIIRYFIRGTQNIYN